MGFFDNIGSTILDVQQGMEYAKQNQRRDAEWERNQKRADTADKVSQYGLEDLERGRDDKAARRTAAAGQPTLDAAAQAEKTAALARGDTQGAGQAEASRLAALRADFEIAQTELAKELQPAKAGMERTAVAGQVARQPGMEAVAGQQVQDQSMAMREKLLARFYQIATLDKAEALKLISDSPLIFPGKKAVDIMVSKDGQRMAIVGEDGQPLTMLNKPFMDQLSQKYGDPGKVYEVEPGKRLVHATAGGKAKEIYAAPNAPVQNKFSIGADGTVLNTTTGDIRPGPGGAMPAAKRDTRVKVADSIVKEALGGSLNMGLPGEDAQRDYPIIMQKVGELIDKGVPPEKAAYDAMQEVKRAAKVGGLTGNQPQADWRNFVQ